VQPKNITILRTYEEFQQTFSWEVSQQLKRDLKTDSNNNNNGGDNGDGETLNLTRLGQWENRRRMLGEVCLQLRESIAIDEENGEDVVSASTNNSPKNGSQTLSPEANVVRRWRDFVLNSPEGATNFSARSGPGGGGGADKRFLMGAGALGKNSKKIHKADEVLLEGGIAIAVSETHWIEYVASEATSRSNTRRGNPTAF